MPRDRDYACHPRSGRQAVLAPVLAATVVFALLGLARAQDLDQALENAFPEEGTGRHNGIVGDSGIDWSEVDIGEGEPFEERGQTPDDGSPEERTGSLEWAGDGTGAPPPQVAHAEIAFSTTVVSGTLDAGVITAAVGRERRAFDACYGREVGRTGAPADGELAFELTFRDRELRNAQVTRATVSVEIRPCVERALRRLELSAGEDGTAELTITFAPAP